MVGVQITGNNNQIGGTTPAARNRISGNTASGIEIDDGSNNTIQGNFIGTNASGNAALGNGAHGIMLYGNATGNLIGGSAAGAGNVIAANGQMGLDLEGDGTNAPQNN